jgi:hypothetical protein
LRSQATSLLAQKFGELVYSILQDSHSRNLWQICCSFIAAARIHQVPPMATLRKEAADWSPSLTKAQLTILHLATTDRLPQLFSIRIKEQTNPIESSDLSVGNHVTVLQLIRGSSARLGSALGRWNPVEQTGLCIYSAFAPTDQSSSIESFQTNRHFSCTNRTNRTNCTNCTNYLNLCKQRTYQTAQATQNYTNYINRIIIRIDVRLVMCVSS